MADYDFRSLSPHDFELLCRDLLQKPLGVHLESFTAGRDSGIDFRYRDPLASLIAHVKVDTERRDRANLIVQVKHYAESGYEALVRVLKQKERPKLEGLKPTRYILATSVGLTPQRKEELLALMSPWCVGTSDILGKDDINNLLTAYPAIERQHFKLWLTSATVLERVLDAGIFGDSETHVDRIRLSLSRYVPNPSFERAHKILDTTHFCIVAGIAVGQERRGRPRSERRNPKPAAGRRKQRSGGCHRQMRQRWLFARRASGRSTRACR